MRIPPSTGRRLAGIEGLRGLAAISVLITHAWFYSGSDRVPLWEGSPAGTALESLGFGVTLFFTLSGFLLYRPFVAAALDPDRRPRVVDYFRNRALRILPAAITSPTTRIAPSRSCSTAAELPRTPLPELAPTGHAGGEGGKGDRLVALADVL